MTTSQMLLALLCVCAAGVAVSQSVWVDRRIPYYVIPGCDFMLDPGDRCDAAAVAPASTAACCPIGFECVAVPGLDNVFRCLQGPPTYKLQPDCHPYKRVAAHGACTAESCCPDGLECVPLQPGWHSTCEWTGRPIVPPTSFKTSPRQKFTMVARVSDSGSDVATGTQPPMLPEQPEAILPFATATEIHPTEIHATEIHATNSTMDEHLQQEVDSFMMPETGSYATASASPITGLEGLSATQETAPSAVTPAATPLCGTTGNVCPLTTLPSSGCNRSGARWMAPSCTCYDIPSAAAMANAPPPLDVDAVGRWIVRGNGTLASIQGISWFGFNNGQTMVDGLWANYGNCSLTDFPTVLKRIKLLGFNGLRLPFTFSDLEKPPRNLKVDGANKTTRCQADTIEQFTRSLTPPNSYSSDIAAKILNSVYISNSSCPFDTNPTLTIPGSISPKNKHVPGSQDTTTWNRFFWVIQYAVGQGFYVVIDFHHEQQGLQNTPSAFAANWSRLWTDLVSLPTYAQTLSGRVFPELANEWGRYGCRWEKAVTGCSSAYNTSITSAARAIRDAAKAAAQAAPLILVEGVGQGGYNLNKGDGFITDATKISQKGLSDPRSFFLADNAATNSYKIVLAPHVYGPNITGQSEIVSSGVLLWDKSFASWGSKSPAANLTSAGIKQHYAVAVTEFGSDCDIGSEASSPCGTKDTQYLRSLSTYMVDWPGVIPLQYSHHRNTVWFWWCWNANSGDTRGLVSDSRSDPGNAWYSVKWYKMDYLEALRLCPWYRGGRCVGF